MSRTELDISLSLVFPCSLCLPCCGLCMWAVSFFRVSLRWRSMQEDRWNHANDIEPGNTVKSPKHRRHIVFPWEQSILEYLHCYVRGDAAVGFCMHPFVFVCTCVWLHVHAQHAMGWICFNGECFNVRCIRRKHVLLAKGINGHYKEYLLF